jgi:hypothetical protein
MSSSPTPNTLANPAGPNRLLTRLCLIAIAALFTYYVVFHYHHENKDNGGHLGDFRTFYQAAQSARWHRDIYTAGPNSSQMYVYPPLIAFLYTPLTLLPMLPAAHVALLLNTLVLLACMLLAIRSMLERIGAGTVSVGVAALLVCLLSENEMRGVLTMLETDPLVLLSFVLALAWLDRRPVLAGAALAFAINIKYLPVIALPYLLLRRRWAAAAGLVGGTVLLAFLPALLLGWHENLRCLRVSLGGLLVWVGVPPQVSHAIKVHDIRDDLSVSVTSAIARLLEPLGFSNRVVMAIAALTGAATLLGVWRLYRANGFPLWRWPTAAKQVNQPFKGLAAVEWAGLVAAALAFSPDTNTRHLVLAMLVDALAVAVLLARRPGVSRLQAICGAALILLGFIMPMGDRAGPLHHFYFFYSIPGWSLLAGYLLIASNALQILSAPVPFVSDVEPALIDPQPAR